MAEHPKDSVPESREVALQAVHDAADDIARQAARMDLLTPFEDEDQVRSA